ncbi:MAG: hypothetical protein C4304_03430 [candidate division GAL15 bacterium]
MRSWFALGLVPLFLAATVPAVASTPAKPRSSAAPSFDVQGTVEQVAHGWFELSVQRVYRGRLAKGAKLRIQESASTRFLQAGKRASASDLKKGALVRVVGTSTGSGRQARYTATTVTLLQK